VTAGRRGGPRVVGLGGGHGLAVTLEAVRRYSHRITAVVSVADDGGSSGRLRRDLGIPAPGDVRRCLVALAADPDGVVAQAFGRRFERGELVGHPLGNLVIAGLAETTGSFVAAIDEAGRLLDVQGRVLPATEGPVVLGATVAGRLVTGQAAIQQTGGPIELVALEPPDAGAPPDVLTAIAEADQVIIGPGSLFTSVLAVTAVPTIRAALAARGGGVVFVCNLKPSKETIGFDVADHLAALARHGVVPDAVVIDPDAMDLGELPSGGGGGDQPRIVEARLARPNGWSHDVALLAGVLGGLAGVAPLQG